MQRLRIQMAAMVLLAQFATLPCHAQQSRHQGKVSQHRISEMRRILRSYEKKHEPVQLHLIDGSVAEGYVTSVGQDTILLQSKEGEQGIALAGVEQIRAHHLSVKQRAISWTRSW
jgi:sRNA-binding regulator protein Hfq